MDSLASRYANALFSIALEENKVAAYQEQVMSIDSILHEHKEFNDILNHFKVEEKDKKNMVDTVFKKDYDGTIGVVDLVDDAGQIHGSWGGCALIPGVDDLDIIG